MTSTSMVTVVMWSGSEIGGGRESGRQLDWSGSEQFGLVEFFFCMRGCDDRPAARG